MKVGEVAKAAGVNVQTLHYYERVGILKPRSRSSSGYRHYDDTAVRIIRFVKHAQELGFSLDEIQRLLNLRADKEPKCDKVQTQATRHLQDVEAKIAKLEAVRHTLNSLIKDCKNRRTDADCPLIDCLDDERFSVNERTKNGS